MASPLAVIIEGHVGAGKTTALRELQKRTSLFSFHEEPIARWEDHVLWNGRRTNLLKAFYDFPSAESATRLQSQVLLTLLERYEELSGHLPVAVYERSIRAARDVFLGRQRGVIRPEEFTFLWQLGSFGIRRYETGAWSIYLKCCEEETLERVRRRARPAEDNLCDSNLLELKREMDEWAEKHCDAFVDTTGCDPATSAKRIGKIIFDFVDRGRPIKLSV